MCRRTIVRNACLAQCLVLRDISVRIRKRFPTMNSLVEAGISVPYYLRRRNLYRADLSSYMLKGQKEHS